jgi:hypothetical protein
MISDLRFRLRCWLKYRLTPARCLKRVNDPVLLIYFATKHPRSPVHIAALDRLVSPCVAMWVKREDRTGIRALALGRVIDRCLGDVLTHDADIAVREKAFQMLADRKSPAEQPSQWDGIA